MGGGAEASPSAANRQQRPAVAPEAFLPPETHSQEVFSAEEAVDEKKSSLFGDKTKKSKIISFSFSCSQS